MMRSTETEASYPQLHLGAQIAVKDVMMKAN